MQHLTADISLWSFPASLILGMAFMLGIWTLDRYYRQSRFCRTLGGGRMAVILILLCTAAIAAEGIWATELYRTWPFIILMLALTASLGLATLHRLCTRPDAGFLLNHAGLFLILWGGLFGTPDLQQGRMMVRTGESAALAYAPSGEVIPLPFEVRLERFTIDYYDDGRTPRQFRSAVLLGGKRAEIAVNAPVRHGGYTFYQDSYDTRRGQYTILLVVRDRWLWVVWCGVAMLAAGSLLMLLRKR